MEKFDVIVIGSGPGGYPAAIRAAQLGANTAIIEKDTLGGTCLNWGCIPTKTLIASSDLFYRIQHAEDLGLKAGKSTFDYAAMARRKDAVVKKLNGGVASLLKANRVTVIEGTASFKTRNTLEIKKGKESSVIAGDKIIIATGSTSSMPGFLPKSKLIMESKKFLSLKELPRTLIVMGGGVIGCEFACMAAQLGSKVTIVEMLEDILLVVDKDIRSEVRRHMEKDLGIEILTGSPLENIKATQDKVRGTAGDKKLSADVLLVSIGRLPYTDKLCLENAGVAMNERGFIEVSGTMRTSVAAVYAIGDVTAGTTQLAHAATAQGVTAAENAVGPKQEPANNLVPACIFTSPEIGVVGITEQAAKEQDLDIKVGKYMLGGLGKALAAGEAEGFVKLVADSDTDQILGAHAVGPHATELISELGAAIRAELTAEELGKTIHCHPTFSESWMEAAHAVHGTCIHQPPKRR